jgi:phospholipid/cholesterol/gamma-HCH transport system substrate-binding protein
MTLQQVTSLAARAETTLDQGDAALESGRRTLDSADLFIREELPRIVTETRIDAASVRGQVDALGTQAMAMLSEFSTTGAVATNRLRELETTIAEANRMITQVTTAVDTVTPPPPPPAPSSRRTRPGLPPTRGPHHQRQRGRLAALTSRRRTSPPSSPTSGRRPKPPPARSRPWAPTSPAPRAGPTRSQARSNGPSAPSPTPSRTRTARSPASTPRSKPGTGRSTAAQRAFTSADRVLNTDVGTITARLEQTLGELEAAIDTVTADVPAISATSDRRRNGRTPRWRRSSRPPNSLAPSLQTFATQALPQYSRLAGEARQLVDNLNQLVRQIERDPARYFLGGDAPAFRR